MKNKLEALLLDVQAAYDESNVKKEHPGLFYSLITGSLELKQPLIIGFNWGAAQDERYTAQTVDDFEKPLFSEDVGSIKRIFSFCNRHLGQGYLDQGSQTNFCFFRSKIDSDIDDADLSRCKPVFNKLVEVLQPSAILCFSSRLREYLIESNQVTDLQSLSNLNFSRGGNNIRCYAVKGRFNNVDIAFLPHPNSPIPGAIRRQAWEFACGN